MAHIGKTAVLRLMRGLALNRFILQSKWRDRRIAILCFHGISIKDEHECFPGFFTTRELFRQKLSLIRKLDLNVLPLDEALTRLEHGTLPKRSVVVTLDDGFYGAYLHGANILAEFGVPATVYLTTHYVKHRRPVFDNMLAYLLWKGAGRELCWPEITRNPILLGPATQKAAFEAIHKYCGMRYLPSKAKDHLLSSLADKLQIEYEALRRERLLELVNADEMRNWRNAQFELHTHRHRISRDKTLFVELIQKNRKELYRITGRTSVHFAYPSSTYFSEHPDWLRELGIRSAATCDPGLAGPQTDPYQLPRIVDLGAITSPQYLEDWITGVTALFPRQPCLPDMSQVETERPKAAAARA